VRNGWGEEGLGDERIGGKGGKVREEGFEG
jgi:hypothetical protein